MWAVSYAYPARPRHYHIHISKPTITPLRPPSQFVVSATNSQPQSGDNGSNTIGGLGRTISTALQSNPKPKPKPTSVVPNPEEKSKPREYDDQEDGTQISGSDVLWAMKKVADKKHRRKKQNSGKGRESLLSSVGGRREVFGGASAGSDYQRDVRPFLVKSDWAWKLDELEKRLEELSETK